MNNMSSSKGQRRGNPTLLGSAVVLVLRITVDLGNLIGP